MFFYPAPREDDQILVAAKAGDLNLIQKLRDEAGDDEAFRRQCEFVAETCLHIAAERGNLEICRFLIEEVKMNINCKTYRVETPLLLAALKGQVRAANYFIIRGADVKMGDYQGTTCLHIAAENGNKEMMQLLLEKGADIEAHSVKGTPLQCAASCAIVESVRFLLSRGADPNARSALSVSPLMEAIYRRSHELLKLLLKAGADPNKESHGLTPLAVAAKDYDMQFLRSLLDSGANPSKPTVELMFPIEYAVLVGNTEGASILLPKTLWLGRYIWSIPEIENYVHSESTKAERKELQDEALWYFDKGGKREAKKEAWRVASEWFNSAIDVEPKNARLRSNRSLCWAKLNEPVFALHDAEASIMVQPDWHKAHYRAGAAWMLLENYSKAWASFKKASELNRGNMEIKKALSLALKPGILGAAELDLLKTVNILADLVPFCENFYVKLRDLAEKEPTMAMEVLCEFLDRPDLPDLL